VARAPLSHAWLLPALLALAACASPGLQSGPPAKGPGLAPVPSVPQPSPTPAPSFPQQKPLDEEQPLKVRSKGLRYDHAAEESVFYGGVTVTQDSTVLQARELHSQTQGQSARAEGGVLLRDPVRRFQARAGRVEYTGALRAALLEGGLELVSVDPYGRPVTVTGQSGSFSDLSRAALVRGGVKVRRGSLRATADSAQVRDGGEQLQLQGSVRGSFGLDRVQADLIELDQVGKAITLDGKVRARVVPKDLRQAMASPWDAGSGQEAP
jgi:lipopolysaccharide export system protein LptA